MITSTVVAYLLMKTGAVLNMVSSGAWLQLLNWRIFCRLLSLGHHVLHHLLVLTSLLVLSVSLGGCGRDGSSVEDASSPVGTWYLVADGVRYEMEIYRSAVGRYEGNIHREGESAESLSNISWDENSRWLELRHDGSGFYRWYRVRIVQGVAAGRFSHGVSPAKPLLTAYTHHVTGWSPTYLDLRDMPRTWRVTLKGNYDAVLRIDRDASGALRGSLKVFDDNSVPEVQEELEYELSSIYWDGTQLSFVRNGEGWSERFVGMATGRFIAGTYTVNGTGTGTYPWNGERAQVLGFGLGSRLAQRDTWQRQTRARIMNITEGMRLASEVNPPSTVTVAACADCPFTSGGYFSERDDDPGSWPAQYTLQKLQFSVRPGNSFDPANPPPPREFEGYLAFPTTPPPLGGYTAFVALNGHDGSAQHSMTQSDRYYWYGESAARRNMVVLAVDIGHRPEWFAGPVFHPAIIGSSYTATDWEEEGERSLNVRAAIDYLVSLPGVRSDRIYVGGLSLGGAIATIASGLDPRAAMVTVSGYSPDMFVMDRNWAHPCYRWKRADIHEYLDVSDYQALIAPRPLIVQTGQRDFLFSPLPTPWVVDKQVTRRARMAYGNDAAKLVHYLHYDSHGFHVGDYNPMNPSRPRGILATQVIEPSTESDLTWQTDATTYLRSPSLYHLMNELYPD